MLSQLKSNKWQGAIFDWNGTLLDDLDFMFGSVVEIFSRYNVPVPDRQAFNSSLSSGYMATYYAFGIPKSATSDDLNKIRNEYMDKNWLPQRTKLMDGALDFIHLCQKLGMRLAIVSAEKKERLYPALDNFGLTGEFDLIISNASPKKEYLAKAPGLLHVFPEDCFYLDDLPEGCLISRELGITAIAFLGGYGSQEKIMKTKPDFVIRDFRDLVEK